MNEKISQRQEKSLNDLSLEELWELFPIFLTPHDDRWEKWFNEEKRSLEKIINDPSISFNHIGSTAILKIWAKPIIDILLIIPKTKDMNKIHRILLKNGYLCMAKDRYRCSFNKGYTINGFADKVFHIHLRYMDDIDEIYFRDYLILHPSIAKAYERLKLQLWPKFIHDRDGYTNAKTAFITYCTKIAKKSLRSN